jgi:leucyl aminopeptidase
VEIKAVIGEITGMKAGALIVNHFDGDKRPEGDAVSIDKALDGALSQLIKQGEIKGKLNEITLIHSLGKIPAGRVAVVGLGKKSELTADKVRAAVAEACRYLRQKSADSIACGLQGAGINDLSPENAAQSIIEGALLGLYTFRRYITKTENHFGEIKQFSIVCDKKQKPSIDKAIDKGRIMAEAANWSRDRVNEPSNYLTPTRLAEYAKELAKKYKLDIEVLDRKQMASLGMGGLLGVSQGSQQPPKFIIMNYKGRNSNNIDVALVGKGITFDTGGIDLKPQDGMEDMKGDMAGGAACMAALSAIAQLKIKLNVMTLVPATENMPSGTAMKPGDIITAMNGKTIEVLNTDAEGRLILADALSYAAKHGAKAIIDVATLTGACHVALGSLCSGAFTNNQKLVDKVMASGNEVGERAWQLPMYAEYRELLKSDIADMKNIGNRYGGAITAAKFLEEFVDKIPWVHMDIAGTSDTDKEKGYLVKGGTGVPVRTLVNLVLSMAK